MDRESHAKTRRQASRLATNDKRPRLVRSGRLDPTSVGKQNGSPRAELVELVSLDRGRRECDIPERRTLTEFGVVELEQLKRILDIEHPRACKLLKNAPPAAKPVPVRGRNSRAAFAETFLVANGQNILKIGVLEDDLVQGPQLRCQSESEFVGESEMAPADDVDQIPLTQPLTRPVRNLME
jgi:hypothetical protein